MIPNILNTGIGLLLVYAAVLAPGLLSGRYYPLVIVSFVMLALAHWAMRSDHHPWQNIVNMSMCLLLFVLGVLPFGLYPIVMFWGVFWVGTVIAVLALWAALYRPAPGAAAH